MSFMQRAVRNAQRTEARQFHTTPAFRAGGGPGPVKPEYKRAIAEYTKKKPGSLGIGRAIYNTFMKRTSVYAMAIVVGAIVLEEGHDQVINYLWDANNKGKSFKDIIDKFPAVPPGCGDDDE